MWICIDLNAIFVLWQNNVVNLILQRRLFYTNAFNILFCLLIFQQFIIYNSIAINVFNRKEQNKLVVLIKSSNSSTFLVKKYRLFRDNVRSMLCFWQPFIEIMKPGDRLLFNKLLCNTLNILQSLANAKNTIIIKVPGTTIDDSILIEVRLNQILNIAKQCLVISLNFVTS